MRFLSSFFTFLMSHKKGSRRFSPYRHMYRPTLRYWSLEGVGVPAMWHCKLHVACHHEEWRRFVPPRTKIFVGPVGPRKSWTTSKAPRRSWRVWCSHRISRSMWYWIVFPRPILVTCPWTTRHYFNMMRILNTFWPRTMCIGAWVGLPVIGFVPVSNVRRVCRGYGPTDTRDSFGSVFQIRRESYNGSPSGSRTGNCIHTLTRRTSSQKVSRKPLTIYSRDV